MLEVNNFFINSSSSLLLLFFFFFLFLPVLSFFSDDRTKTQLVHWVIGFPAFTWLVFCVSSSSLVFFIPSLLFLACDLLFDWHEILRLFSLLCDVSCVTPWVLLHDLSHKSCSRTVLMETAVGLVDDNDDDQSRKRTSMSFARRRE